MTALTEQTPLAELWPALTCAVGRVVDTDHNPLTVAAVGSMLDLVETAHETGTLTADVLADAIAWCDRIAALGYVTAGPWAGWFAGWNGTTYEARET